MARFGAKLLCVRPGAIASLDMLTIKMEYEWQPVGALKRGQLLQNSEEQHARIADYVMYLELLLEYTKGVPFGTPFFYAELGSDPLECR